MIVIKHGHRPEPKRWKFVCSCGCEWIADEFEVSSVYSYQDICEHSLMHYHAVSGCPECGHNVKDERRIYAEEYESIWMQTDPSALVRYVNLGDGITTQTEEEKPF